MSTTPAPSIVFVPETLPKPSIVFLTGTSNLPLANEIARLLGVPCHVCAKDKFANGETSVTIPISIRGADVYVFQPTTSCQNVNDACMELFVILQAAKLSSPLRITAVIPSFAYARQDRKSKPHEPITAKLIADFIVAAGADRVMAMDLHADQEVGFFSVPVDNLSAMLLLARYVADRFEIVCGNESIANTEQNKKKKADIVIVSPDAGGVKRARDFASAIGSDVDIAIIHKHRPQPGVVGDMKIVGDVKGRTAIIVDDISDTLGTLNSAANVLKNAGAKSVIACATHGLLSGKAISVLQQRNFDLVVTDTNNIDKTLAQQSVTSMPNLFVVSVADLLAVAIKKHHNGQSLSELYYLDKLEAQVPKRNAKTF